MLWWVIFPRLPLIIHLNLGKHIESILDLVAITSAILLGQEDHRLKICLSYREFTTCLVN